MNQKQVKLKEVRKFGILLGIILLVIGSIQLFKGHTRVFMWLSTLSTIFLIMATLLTRWLVPFYILFTKITHAIGWFNTRLLLSIIFYLLITPFGLIMRLFEKDPLNRRIEKEKDSYWIKKEPLAEEDIVRYEKQF